MLGWRRRLERIESGEEEGLLLLRTRWFGEEEAICWLRELREEGSPCSLLLEERRDRRVQLLPLSKNLLSPNPKLVSREEELVEELERQLLEE